MSSEASSDLMPPQPANNRHSVPTFPTSINISNYHSFALPTDTSAARPNSIAVMDTINEGRGGGHDGSGSSDMGGDKLGKAKLFDMRLLSESIDQGIGKQEGVTLEDALYSLKSTLEDYQGQYPELQKLELQIRKLDKLLKVDNKYKYRDLLYS